MTCQRCDEAEAEWKVREYTAAGTIRWWYLCDICLMENYGPWLPKRIPPLEDDQIWVSEKGGQTFRKASSPSTSPAQTT